MILLRGPPRGGQRADRPRARRPTSATWRPARTTCTSGSSSPAASCSGARRRPRPSRTSRPRRPASPTWSGKESPYLLLAQLYRGGDEIEKAIAELEGYAAVAGEDYGVRKELKAWYRDRGDHARVVELCGEMVEISPVRRRPGRAARPGAAPGLRRGAARAGPQGRGPARAGGPGRARGDAAGRRRASRREAVDTHLRLGEMYLGAGPSARRARAGHRGPSPLPRRRRRAYAEGPGGGGRGLPVSATHRAIQEEIREELVREVGRNRYRLWFRDTEVLGVDEHAVTFAVPTEVHRTWLEYTYGDELRRAVTQVLGDGVDVQLRGQPPRACKREVRDRLPTTPAGLGGPARGAPAACPRSRASSATGPSASRRCCSRSSSTATARSIRPPSTSTARRARARPHLLRGAGARGRGLRARGRSLYLTSRRFTSLYVSALRATGARRGPRVRGRRRAPAARADRRRASAGRTQGDAARARSPAREGRGDARRASSSRRGRTPQELERISRAAALVAHGRRDAQAEAPDRDGLARILEARGLAYGAAGGADGGARPRSSTARARCSGAVDVLDRWAAASAELGRPLEAEWLEEIAPVRLGHGARGDHPAGEARRLRPLRAPAARCSSDRRRPGAPRSRAASRCTSSTARPPSRWPRSGGRSGCGATAA